MKFEDLLFKEFVFYGTSQLRFKLDDRVWKPLPPDYAAVEVSESVPKGAFFAEPLARVKVELVAGPEFMGLQLTDVADDHCWLRFGDNERGPGRWEFNFCLHLTATQRPRFAKAASTSEFFAANKTLLSGLPMP